MADVPRNIDGVSDDRRPAEAGEPPMFRFGLRQMFWFVSGVAALGGAMALVRGGWALGIAFGAAMVAAHVLATSVGTRLRDRSTDVAAANRRPACSIRKRLPPGG